MHLGIHRETGPNLAKLGDVRFLDPTRSNRSKLWISTRPTLKKKHLLNDDDQYRYNRLKIPIYII